MFSLESYQYRKRKSPEIISNTIMSAAMGLKNEIETVVVNKPTVFEPLKFYCTWVILRFKSQKCIQ